MADEGAFDERNVNDVETAKLALRWALDRIRVVEEQKLVLKQELQEKTHQIQFLEQKAKSGEPPILHELQKQAQDLQKALKLKEIELAAVLDVQKVVGPRPAGDREAELQTRLREKEVENAVLKLETERLSRQGGAVGEAQQKAWDERRIQLMEEFRVRSQRLDDDYRRKIQALGDHQRAVQQELVRRQQSILDRAWKRLQLTYSEKQRQAEAERARWEKALSSAELEIRGKLVALETQLERQWGERRKSLESEHELRLREETARIEAELQAKAGAAEEAGEARRLDLLEEARKEAAEQREKARQELETRRAELDAERQKLLEQASQRKAEALAELERRRREGEATLKLAKEELELRRSSSEAQWSRKEAELRAALEAERKRFLASWAEERGALEQDREAALAASRDAFERKLAQSREDFELKLGQAAEGYATELRNRDAQAESFQKELSARYQALWERERDAARAAREKADLDVAKAAEAAETRLAAAIKEARDKFASDVEIERRRALEAGAEARAAVERERASAEKARQEAVEKGGRLDARARELEEKAVREAQRQEGLFQRRVREVEKTWAAEWARREAELAQAHERSLSEARSQFDAELEKVRASQRDELSKLHSASQVQGTDAALRLDEAVAAEREASDRRLRSERHRLAELLTRVRARYRTLEDDLRSRHAEERQAAAVELERTFHERLEGLEADFRAKRQAAEAERQKALEAAAAEREGLSAREAERKAQAEAERAAADKRLSERQAELAALQAALEERQKARLAELETEAQGLRRRFEAGEAEGRALWTRRAEELSRRAAELEAEAKRRDQEAEALRGELEKTRTELEGERRALRAKIQEFETLRALEQQRLEEQRDVLKEEQAERLARSEEELAARYQADREREDRRRQDELEKARSDAAEREKRHAAELAEKEAAFTERLGKELREQLSTLEAELRARDLEFQQWRLQLTEHHQAQLARERQLAEIQRQEWIQNEKLVFEEERSRLRHEAAERQARGAEETLKLRQHYEERLQRDRELWMQREQALQKKLEALDQQWRQRWLEKGGPGEPPPEKA